MGSESFARLQMKCDSIEFAMPSLDDETQSADALAWSRGWEGFKASLSRFSQSFPQVKIYIEQDWKKSEASSFARFSEFSSKFENVHMKVRTGGLVKEAIPSVSDLAQVILACAAHRIDIKCTAGLHASLREVSPRFQFRMHGFLNVLGAVAVARNQPDLSLNSMKNTSLLDSIQSVLNAESASDWKQELETRLGKNYEIDLERPGLTCTALVLAACKSRWIIARSWPLSKLNNK